MLDYRIGLERREIPASSRRPVDEIGGSMTESEHKQYLHDVMDDFEGIPVCRDDTRAMLVFGALAGCLIWAAIGCVALLVVRVVHVICGKVGC